jgi:hypothetical protein
VTVEPARAAGSREQFGARGGAFRRNIVTVAERPGRRIYGTLGGNPETR